MKEKVLQKIFPAFGTINTITIYGDCPGEVAEHIKKRALELHRSLSVFDADSDISRMNRQAGNAPAAVLQDTFFLLSRGLAYGKETCGAFDITSGALSQLWRKAISSGKMPTEEEVVQCRSLNGLHNLKLDEGASTAFLCKKGQQADLGGIAKGYAADEAGRILKEHKVQNAWINFGGTILSIGKEQRIGIQNPFQKTGKAIACVAVQNKAVVTSGFYERCFYFRGRRYHHIIDPFTGWPSGSGLASVTLIGGCAMELDALATGICVLGEEKGRLILEKHGIEAVFITEAGVVKITPGLQEKFYQ